MATAPPELLRGDRVVVRRHRLEDAPALVRAVTESLDHLRPFMGWIADEPQTVAQRLAFIEACRASWEAGENFPMTMVSPGDDTLIIGGTGLLRRVGPGALEIGYWVHVDHVGRGIATESSRLLTDAAFGLDGIDRVEIHHDRANVASAAVPRKLGYRVAGDVAREAQAPADTGVDHVWVMDRTAWLAARSSR
jgi:RimJ/RimL family protein N-acetyltransferase